MEFLGIAHTLLAVVGDIDKAINHFFPGKFVIVFYRYLQL